MTSKLLLIASAILPIVFGRIHLAIDIFNNDTYTVEPTGRATRTVDSVELPLFSVTQDRLRTGVEALAGSRPDQVFFTEPGGSYGTPFLDNAWRESISVTAAVSYDPVVISRLIVRHTKATIRNHGNHVREYRTAINMNVNHTAENSWSGVALAEDNIFDYRFTTEDSRIFDYSNVWGARHRETLMTDTTTEFPLIRLEPNQSVSIVSWRKIMRARSRIVYQTHLDGQVVGYWRRGLNGRQFWAYDVLPVLRFGGMPTTAFTVEQIDLEFNLGYEINFETPDDNDNLDNEVETQYV